MKIQEKVADVTCEWPPDRVDSRRGKIKVAYVANCVYSSLVASTGACYLVSTREAVLIGFMRYAIRLLRYHATS